RRVSSPPRRCAASCPSRPCATRCLTTSPITCPAASTPSPAGTAATHGWCRSVQPRFDITVDEAIAVIQERARRQAAEHGSSEVVIAGAARGRVLTEDLASLVDRPTGNDSALDGFACLARDTAAASEADPVSLVLVGTSVAGRPFAGRLDAGQAVAVATGALVPDGADAVIGVEHARADAGTVSVSRPADTRAVRPMAQDLRRGTTYLRRGTRLTSAAVGLAA